MFAATVGIGYKSELFFMTDSSKFVRGEKKGREKLTNFKVDGSAYIAKILEPLYKDFKKQGWIKRGKLTRIFQQGKIISKIAIF